MIQLENILGSRQADIVLGKESWLNSQHLSTAMFPKGFKVYRKDRVHRAGGGVFIMVSEKFISSEPGELKVDAHCEMVWVYVKFLELHNYTLVLFVDPPTKMILLTLTN